MKHDQNVLKTTDELDVRLDGLRKTGERLNDEYGRCLDRAGLLISIAKSLGTDHLNAAKAGFSGPRFDIADVFKGIDDELSNAQLHEQALDECRATMLDLWTLKRAMR